MEQTVTTSPQDGPRAALQSAIDKAGGITVLSKLLNLNSHAVIQQWRIHRVPADYCPDLERLTGIKCERLRPDVNWAVLRKTPRKVKAA